MSKVLDALNTMLANSAAITEVTPTSRSDSTELFFLYNEKYKWSISSGQASYWVYYYPGKESIEELAAIQDWDEYNNYAVYSSKKLGGDAVKVMSELYELVKDRRFNMNHVLDEIINTPSKS